MQAIDIFKLSTRVFRTNKLRTSLTIFGIGVGIGTILFLVSFGFGLQKVILDQITTSDALLSLDVSSEASSAIELDQESEKDLQAIPEIKEVSSITSVPAQIEINSLNSGSVINAVNPSFFRLAGTQVGQGELFKEGESKKAVISSATLKTFGISDDDNLLGKMMSIKLYLSKKVTEGDMGENIEEIEEIKEVNLEDEFEIVGIIEDDNSSYVYLPYSDVSHLNLPNFSMSKIRVENKDDLGLVRSKIIEKGFSVSALSDVIDEANKIFQVVQIILSLFGAVALIVSAIGMFNTMTIALLERIQEIGVMKALGASKKDIWQMFLVESIVIGFLGGVSGIFIGIIGGKLFNFGINKLANSLGGVAVNLFYTPQGFIIIILIFSTIVGFLTGLYPARRASKLNALDALRYK